MPPERVEEAMEMALYAREMPIWRMLENGIASMSLSQDLLKLECLGEQQKDLYFTFQEFAESIFKKDVPEFQEALKNLRFFGEPSSAPDSSKINLVMCHDTGTDFERLDTKEKFEAFLKDFISALAKGKKPQLTDVDLVQQFDKIFKKRFEEEDVPQGVPWNMRLRFMEVTREIGVATYLRIPTLGSISTFSFENIEDGMRQLFDYAQSARFIAGDAEELTVLGKVPSHAFRILVNDPSMKLPFGESFEANMKKRREKVFGCDLREKTRLSSTLSSDMGLAFLNFAQKILYKKLPADLDTEVLGSNYLKVLENIESSTNKVTVQDLISLFEREIAAVVPGFKLSAEDLQSIDEEFLKLDTTQKDYKSLFITFADSNWEEAQATKSASKYFQFYLNPRIGNWQIIRYPPGSFETLFTKDAVLEIGIEAGIMGPVAREKQLLVARFELQQQMADIAENFYNALDKVEKGIGKLSAKNTKLITDIINSSKTDEEVLEKLKKVDATLKDFVEELIKVYEQRGLYKQALEELRKKQTPLVEVSQELFVTATGGIPGDFVDALVTDQVSAKKALLKILKLSSTKRETVSMKT